MSRIDIDYTVRQKSGAVTHFSETHLLGLFSRDQIQNAFHLAGLTATYAEPGLHNKGIYIAQKSPNTP